MRTAYVLLLSFFLLYSTQLTAQVTGSFVVKGDADKYYPVIFTDGDGTTIWQRS